MKLLFLTAVCLFSITCQVCGSAVFDLTGDDDEDVQIVSWTGPAVAPAPHSVIDLTDEDDEVMAGAAGGVAAPAGALATPVQRHRVADADREPVHPGDKLIPQGIAWKRLLGNEAEPAKRALLFVGMVVEIPQPAAHIPGEGAAAIVAPAIGGAGILAAPAPIVPAPRVHGYSLVAGPHTKSYPFAAPGRAFLNRIQIDWAKFWERTLFTRYDLEDWERVRPLANYIPCFGWTKLSEGRATHAENCQMCGHRMPGNNVAVVKHDRYPTIAKILRVDSNCAKIMTLTRDEVREAARE